MIKIKSIGVIFLCLGLVSTYGEQQVQVSSSEGLPLGIWRKVISGIEVDEADAVKPKAAKSSLRCYAGMHDGLDFNPILVSEVTCPVGTEFCIKVAVEASFSNEKFVQYGCGERNVYYQETCIKVEESGITGTLCACKGDLCNGAASIVGNIFLSILASLVMKTVIF